MLNSSGFAFALIRFYFAFTVFFHCTLSLLSFYIVKHRRPYFAGCAIQIWSIDSLIDSFFAVTSTALRCLMLLFPLWRFLTARTFWCFLLVRRKSSPLSNPSATFPMTSHQVFACFLSSPRMLLRISRISRPPRLLAECHKGRRNKDSLLCLELLSCVFSRVV